MNRHLLVFHLIALAIRLVASEVDISELELIENDEDMLRCFTDLACKYEKHEDLKNCLTIIKSPKEQEYVKNMLRGLASGNINYTGFSHIEDYFCSLSSKEQTEFFEELVSELLEKYMDICHDETESDACEDYMNMFECQMGLLEKGTSEGLCSL